MDRKSNNANCFLYIYNQNTTQPQPNHTTKGQSALISSHNILSIKNRQLFGQNKPYCGFGGVSETSLCFGETDNLSTMVKGVMVTKQKVKKQCKSRWKSGTKPILLF